MGEVLTVNRMARRLGVTARWLRAEAEAGRVPCLRAGNRYLFNPLAVEQALAQRAAEGGVRAGTDVPQPPRGTATDHKGMDHTMKEDHE
jgi:excisionase family DNA binding protein